MKTLSTQQEILLVTGTSFSRRPWCEKEIPTDQLITDREQLEKACWNGLFKEMLPEICEKSASGKELYLWKVNELSSFIELELSDYPSKKEEWYSIDPYTYLSTKSYN